MGTQLRRYGFVAVRVLYVVGIVYSVVALMLVSSGWHAAAVTLALGITYAAGAHARETFLRPLGEARG